MSTTKAATADFGETDPRERPDEMDDEVNEWIDELIEEIREARESEHFREYLDAAVRFHDYSPRNQLLIKLQKPDATRVAGYNTWQSEFDRYVKEGESGIYITAPKTISGHKCPDCGNAPAYHSGNKTLDCPRADSDPASWDFDPREEWEHGSIMCGFTSATVFDISQTEGEEVPELDYDAKAGDRDDMEELVDSLQVAGETLGFDMGLVEESEWSRSGNGYCDTDDDQPEIRVCEREAAATAGTQIHELAHAVLHADDDAPDEREEREVEADAVAYIVGRRLGLDMSGRSFYLASWTTDEAEIIRKRLRRINNAANTITSTVEE
jgi:hypothetical protein